MSVYLSKGAKLELTRGTKSIQFSNSVTDQKVQSELLRLVTDFSGSGHSKRRPFKMYMKFLNESDTKLSNDSPMSHLYGALVRSILTPFIDENTGNYNGNAKPSADVIGKMRIDVDRILKRLTGCGAVSLVLDTDTTTESSITFFINDCLSDKESKAYNNFKVGSTGLKLDVEETLTMVVSMKFIKDFIAKQYTVTVGELRAGGIDIGKNEDLVRVESERAIIENCSRIIMKSLIASQYKEYIFHKFVGESRTIANGLIASYTSGVAWDSFLPVVREDEVMNLSHDNIVRFLLDNVDAMNPSSLMDVFEINSKEVNTFINSMGIETNYSAEVTPKYESLIKDPSKYLDRDSARFANVAFVNKFNEIIISLMMSTKLSIKESQRTSYVKAIKGSIENINSKSPHGMVTKNTTLIVQDIKKQLEIINKLASNLVKLRDFTSR